jgi:hypothetical protein
MIAALTAESFRRMINSSQLGISFIVLPPFLELEVSRVWYNALFNQRGFNHRLDRMACKLRLKCGTHLFGVALVSLLAEQIVEYN